MAHVFAKNSCEGVTRDFLMPCNAPGISRYLHTSGKGTLQDVEAYSFESRFLN